MKHAFIDRYASLDSPIHRLSSPVKLGTALIALSFLLIITAFSLQNHIIQIIFAIYLFCIIGIILISKVPFGFLISRSLLILPLSLLVILLNLFMADVSMLKIISILERAFLSILTVILLVSVIPFHDLLHQLSRWYVPRIIILTLSFMYRYFFLLIEEIETMQRALLMRRPGIRGIKRINIYANMLGMLIIRSYERAERVYQAMLMRGFTGDLR